MDRQRPGAPQGRIPEAWIGREVMVETTETLSSDLRAAVPVYLEDVDDRDAAVPMSWGHDSLKQERNAL